MPPQLGNESLGAHAWRRRRWLASGLIVAILAVLATSYRIQLLPPSLERTSIEFAASTTQVMVDFPGQSSLLDTDRPVGPLAERANVYARLAASPAIVTLIGKQAGIDPAQIDARGPYNPDAQRALREPTAERRASQLRAEGKDYRLRFDTEQDEAVPIVLVYTQAPTVEDARKLANAAAGGLIRYVRQVQRRQDLDEAARLQLRQLGRPEGGIVNPGADRQVAVLAFLAALLAWSVLVMVVSNLRLPLAARARGRPAPTPPVSPTAFDLDEESLDSRFVGSSR